jgi:hypothetical protein
LTRETGVGEISNELADSLVGAFLTVASIAVTLIVDLDAPVARLDVENAPPAPLTT